MLRDHSIPEGLYDNVPEGFAPIQPDELPENVRQLLRPMSKVAGYDLDSPEAADRIAAYTYPGSLDRCFIGTFQVRDNERFSEERTALIDITPEGVVSGAATINYYYRNALHPEMAGVPYAGYTTTYGAYLRQGLAERRLHAMGVVARHLYDQPLRSGTTQEPETVALWNKLVANGEALAEPEGSAFRYKLVT